MNSNAKEVARVLVRNMESHLDLVIPDQVREELLFLVESEIIAAYTAGVQNGKKKP